MRKENTGRICQNDNSAPNCGISFSVFFLLNWWVKIWILNVFIENSKEVLTNRVTNIDTVYYDYILIKIMLL